MSRLWVKFIAIFLAVVIIDQAIKQVFLSGFRWDGEFFSLILTFNKGVAFSMFAFLGEHLKALQTILLVALFGYLLYEKKLLKANTLPFALLFGGGVSNLIDRFIREGVVDYVFWHKYFEFAVFNFADVMINLAIFIMLIQIFIHKK